MTKPFWRFSRPNVFCKVPSHQGLPLTTIVSGGQDEAEAASYWGSFETSVERDAALARAECWSCLATGMEPFFGLRFETRHGGLHELPLSVTLCRSTCEDFEHPASRGGLLDRGQEGSQRLVCDARTTNQLRGAAPLAQRGTPGAMSNLIDDRKVDGQPFYGATTDLVDSFDHFGIERHCQWLGVSMFVSAAECRVQSLL